MVGQVRNLNREVEEGKNFSGIFFSRVKVSKERVVTWKAGNQLHNLTTLEENAPHLIDIDERTIPANSNGCVLIRISWVHPQNLLWPYMMAAQIVSTYIGVNDYTSVHIVICENTADGF